MDLSEVVKIGVVVLAVVLFLVIMIPVVYGMISNRRGKREKESAEAKVKDLHTLAQQAQAKQKRHTAAEQHDAAPIHLRTGEHTPRQGEQPRNTKPELPQIIIHEKPPPPPPPPPKKQVDWRQQWQ